jgi:hypothetical protein
MLKNNGAHPVEETERRMELLCVNFRTGTTAAQAFASSAPHTTSTVPVSITQRSPVLRGIVTTSNDCAIS